jgi:hypothetical protein
VPANKPRDVDAKLRLVARLLGCRTRKELCARFRDADPATAFRPDRLAKWMQGAAAPREGRAYAEIAQALRIERSATWVAESTLAEFEAEARRAQDAARAADASSPAGDNSHICGEYHCLSPAWSDYYAGQLIRGRLSLSAGPGGALRADYVEAIAGKPVGFRGPVTATPRNLQMMLREPSAGIGVVLTTYLPGHPASVLCGMLSGATVLGPQLAPAAGRFVALRLPDGAPPGPTGYVAPLPDVVTADLRTLGLAAMPVLGQEVVAFLSGGGRSAADRVGWAEQERLARLADLLHLPDAAERGPAGTAPHAAAAKSPA